MAEGSLLKRVRQRKLVQWALAYIGGSWVVLQAIDLLTQNLELSHTVFRVALVLLAAGLPAVLVLAWYHGEKGTQRASSVELLMLTGILVIAGAAVGFISDGRRAATSPLPRAAVASARPAVEKGSIAVLPFLDMSPKHDQDYFSDGLTEELLNVLAKVPGLRVAARTSSFAFKGKEVEVDSIGRALHVAHVLEGSVRTEGRHLRITAQLIDAGTGYHLWSDTYDRDLKDVFAVQGEIAQAITQQLRLRIAAGEAESGLAPTADPEVHALVLQAQPLFRAGTRESLAEAARMLEEAVRRDPGYARAHADLGAVYAQQAYYRWAPETERWYGLGRAEAERALALDPREGRAHAVLGRIADLHWDFAGAEAHYLRAIESNPSDARSHVLRAFLLIRLHRTAEALAEAERALALDPVSPSVIGNVGAMYGYVGQHEKALEMALLADRMQPGKVAAVLNLVYAYGVTGHPAEALQTAQRLMVLDSGTMAIGAYAYAINGRRPEAERLMRVAEARWDDSPYFDATVYLALGQRDRALQLLDRAVTTREDYAADLGVDPAFNALHGDPRFQALLRKGGLL